MYDERGSVWRKWDLHVHGPNTSLHNEFPGTNQDEKWEFYLNKLEAVENVSVLGITDYYSIADYQKVIEFKNEGRLDNFDLILPNVEIRITPVTDQNRAINFHFIFNPAIVDELNTLFFNELKFEYDGRPYICNRDSLIRLGRSYLSDPDLDENTAYREGANQFKVPYQDLSKLLKSNKYLRDNVICGVSNNSSDGNSGIQHSSLAATREEIYRLTDFIFSSNPNDVEYFLGDGTDNEEEVRSQYGSLKPCIHGSDAHKLQDICKPDCDRFTWIKADPTFEGLKQVLFEPKSRVEIGENPPPPPPKSIDRLSYNIQEDLFVEKQEDGDREEFCLKGEEEIYFSPNLNCLIGGRGTGKSTILNLMRLKIEDKNVSLYPDSEVIDKEGNSIHFKDLIEIDGTTSEEVEFLSQNEIEQFALNTLEFTRAIYDRLKQVGDRDKLSQKSTELSDFLTEIEKAIDHQNTKLNRLKDLQKKRKSYKDKRKEIEILEDEKYSDLQEEINKYSKELAQLKSSRNNLENMLTDVFEIIQKYQSDTDEDDKNQFDRLVEEGINTLRDFYKENFEKVKKKSEREQELEKELSDAEKELGDYLSELGYEKQNISNISSAQSQANQLELKIEKVEKEINTLEKKVDLISLDDDRRKEFEDLLTPRIDELNETLKKISDDTEEVKEISLEYEYDEKRAFSHFCLLFNRNELPSFETGSSLSKKDVMSLFQSFLQADDDFELKSDEEILEIIHNRRNEIKTNKVIFEYFSSAPREKLKLLKLYYLLHRVNVEQYIKINVTYDGRNIESSSFGQRCTAAIVVLLSLGSNPIIIDEPEAHLDSGLIAKYLVQLIKDRKRHRQIIFATHNANFVINGDSELIHVLDMDKQNKSDITPTTIENKEHRPALYDLEGGKEAFKQRELKYNFQ